MLSINNLIMEFSEGSTNSSEVSMQIYSDSLNDVINCDKFIFDGSKDQAFTFDNFEIPCNKFAAIKLSNSHFQHTIDIDC